MLAVILIWAYTLAAAGLAGWAGSCILKKLLRYEGELRLPFTLQWLLGMAILTCIFSFLSLVIPLSALAQAIVLAISLLSFLAWRRGRTLSLRPVIQAILRVPLPVLILLMLAAGTIFLLALSVPTNDDTGLYHAQTIRWIETYSAVPGLANFQSRLGFNSSWLLTQALFSFAFLGFQSFHLNSSVLFLAASLYFGQGLRSLWSGSRRYSHWMRALFFPLVFYILSSQVSSPGTDAPVTLITWIVLAEWLDFFEEGRLQGQADLRPVILTLISIYAVTLKLSALPLAAIGVFYLAARLFRRSWRATLWAGGLAALFLLPWMARSVVLSGYLVYPFPAVDVFQVDWKVPPARAQLEAETIRAWAQLPRQDLGRVQSMSFRARTVEWFANQTTNRRVILLAVLAAPFLYLGLALWGKLRPFLRSLFKAAWPVWLVTYSGLAYWFFSAPDFRFGAGYILGALALAAVPPALFLRQSRWKNAGQFLPWLVVGMLVVYQGSMLANAVDVKTLPQRLILPADYPGSPTRPCTVDKVTILIPEDNAYGLCWYGVFPCIPYCNQEFAFRGVGWQEGFRYLEPTASP